jgi:hypothetical protein
MSGLNNLTSIGGYLEIYSNKDMTSLTGMEGLTSIGSYLTIFLNGSLTSLVGLDHLTSIGGFLDISFNSDLTSLSGLDNIDPNTISDLHIFWNQSLSTCAVESICDYLAAPNGPVMIEGNATGCNSQEEVDSACIYLSNGEINLGSAFSIHPNPTSTIITLSTPTKPDKNAFMTIYNINGQAIISRQITEQQTVVDVSGLNAGIYFVRVVNDTDVMVGKFVRQ